FAPYCGYSTPTEGSEWIIRCARKPDSRPLYLLMWGLLEDLAQALHDAPDIADKLRVHYIGGPNKKWGPNAYAYIREHFPHLWMIENNATYRGWFNGGDMSGCWGNDTFVQTHAAGHGALGNYFATHLGGVIKMGDTPTVAWLLRGTPTDPCQDSWGGRYMPVRQMPACTLHHPITAETPVEVFSVVEMVIPAPGAMPADKPAFMLEVRGQQFEGFCTAPGEYRVRFVPKEAGDFVYTVRGGVPAAEGCTGVIRAIPEQLATRLDPDGPLTRWWSDDLSPEAAEGPHCGAKTVSCWRRDYLQDFALRFDRCAMPKA
ncbi:MAG: nucleoside hydrolase-like domain-containing protein, partial [Aristaeellaceae bacterium]